MKVFLDIGAHTGETLREVRRPRLGFDRIVSFEPAPQCWPALERLSGPKVELCRFGLWSSDARIDLHNAGDLGASMSAEKDEVTSVSSCEFRDAARWFRENISVDDVVFVKINAEGAEVDVIERLAEEGLLNRIDHLMIHFDVRKIPQKAHREETAKALLEAAGVDYIEAAEIQFGFRGRGTANWVRWVEANPATRDAIYKTGMRAVYRARQKVYPLKAGLVRRGLLSGR